MTGLTPARHTAPGGGAPRFAERFGLFAECLLVGVVVTLALPGVVTVVPALAAGCTHIRAHLDGESTAVRVLLTNVVAAFRSSLPVALLLPTMFVLILADLAIVPLGLPGGRVVAGVCALTALMLAVVTMRAAASWQPGSHWTTLMRQAARRAVRDLRGSLLLVLALIMLLIVTWQLLPLIVAMLGCVVMAAVAVERRG